MKSSRRLEMIEVKNKNDPQLLGTVKERG